MIELAAKYTQTPNKKWDAYIKEYKNISVFQADDLEMARVILRIITAEEMTLTSKNRVSWDITSEHINYYRIPQEVILC